MPLALIFNNNNNVDFIRLVGNESSAFKPLREAVGSHQSNTREQRAGTVPCSGAPKVQTPILDLIVLYMHTTCLRDHFGVFDVGFYTLSNMFVWLLPGPGRAA